MKKQEGRKKENNKRETKKEKGKKGEVQTRLKRNKGKHRKINKNCLFRGKAGFSYLKANKENAKKKKTKQKNKNKEGLGPSEVALWATSPDP